ncbi:MAG: YigZ family protein [bacterium]|nr:YigZ family protein [Candidatus Kapabacteria bacterium]
MPDSFKTIVERVRAEIKVRGSRFIGTALPVNSREQATVDLDAIRKEFWDATHNCFAWRLSPDGLQYRFADDGEPSGSAGKPILFVMQQRELLDTLVVVTRYYGGTKLGVGGLARAYGDAAAAALDIAQIATRYETDTLQVFTTYDDMRAVRQLVEEFALTFEEEFRDVITYRMEIRTTMVEEFAARLTETSQGRAGMINLQQSEIK